MLKLLIADDEKVVLNGLKNIIDWEKLDYSICAEATNGEEALEKILLLQPHLVLLDIKMPKLIGTEVVKQAREQGFKGRFIIISGYSDFKYAQEALRYGVDFYLTKPVDEDELENAAKTIAKALYQLQEEQKTLETYRTKARETILKNLLTGQSTPSKMEMHELHLNAPIYQIVIYESFSKDQFFTLYNFEDLLLINNENYTAFDVIHYQGKHVLLLKGNHSMERFQNFLSHYKRPLQIGSPLHSLFLSYGSPVYKLEDVSSSYNESIALLQRRFFCNPHQHFIGPQDLPCLQETSFVITSDLSLSYCDTFTNYIQSFNRNKLIDTLSELHQKLTHTLDDLNTIKYFLTDIYLQVKARITHLYSTISIPFPSNTSVITYIENTCYLYEIITFIYEQFEMVMKAIGNTSTESVLDDILYYIEHNFHTNLKLETIAPLFGYNSSYLGKLFTKKVGQPFNHYLDEVRIKHAKTLLLQADLKVYEISDQLGYKNVDYFHKKFKKHVGQSPAEYRKEATQCMS